MTNSITTHEFWIHSGILVRLLILVLIVAVFQLWYIMRRLETKFERLRRLTDDRPKDDSQDSPRQGEPSRVITLAGKKTYIMAGLLFLVALMQTLGWLSREACETLGPLLVSLALASLRAGVAKVGASRGQAAPSEPS